MEMYMLIWVTSIILGMVVAQEPKSQKNCRCPFYQPCDAQIQDGRQHHPLNRRTIRTLQQIMIEG